MTNSAKQLQAFALKGNIQPGDPAPWWKQGRTSSPSTAPAAGTSVLGFYGNAGDAIGEAALAALHDNRRFVDDAKASFFGIGMDPHDQSERHVEQRFPAVQFIWDFDGDVHRAYGIAHRTWIVLDPMLRVIDVLLFGTDGADIPQLLALLERLPPPSHHPGAEMPIPVLLLPNVFEPEFCRYLIDCYDANGGRESGFMQEVGGKAVEAYDPAWKRRRDFIITDAALVELIKARMGRRVGVMLTKPIVSPSHGWSGI